MINNNNNDKIEVYNKGFTGTLSPPGDWWGSLPVRSSIFMIDR